MDSDVLASMYAYIVRGGEKESCPYVTDEESGSLFDAVANEVAEKRKSDPNVVFEIPGEVPGHPSTPVMGHEAATAPAPQPSEDEESEDPPEDEESTEPPEKPDDSETEDE